jgi:hypothetical protein
VSAVVIRLADTCPACREALHDRCWQYLGELLGLPHRLCKCLPHCRDEHGDLTQAALVEMARRQPEALARAVRAVAAVERGSLGLHLRPAGRKIGAL